MIDGKKNAAPDGRNIERPRSKSIYANHTTSRDIFQSIKDSLTPEEVARFYGFEPNRSGFICCPFHTEKTPSLKLYENSFHCFGCGAGGSVIDFAARLFGLDVIGAAKRLNSDFNLRLDLDRPPSDDQRNARLARRRFAAWREEMLLTLSSSIRKAHLANFGNLSDSEALAVVYCEALEHWYDTLLRGNLDEQMSIFRNREGVVRLCKRILTDTPMKSMTA